MTKNKVTPLSENFAHVKLQRRSSRLVKRNEQLSLKIKFTEHQAWDVIIPRLGQSLKKLVIF